MTDALSAEMQRLVLEEAAEFEHWYSILEEQFRVYDLHETEWSGLVSGVNNKSLPIHKWYSLKEAYAAELPTWVVNRLTSVYQAKIESVLDPFTGGGTTGVSLAQVGMQVLGIEYNPFIHLVAQTKAGFRRLNNIAVTEAINRIQLVAPDEPISVPRLSTLYNENYFRAIDVQILLNAVRQTRALPCAPDIRNFLLLGIAAAIDDVVNLHKDGRALRYRLKANRLSADEAIARRWRDMISDLDVVDMPGAFDVLLGSAAEMMQSLNSNSFDLVLFSPPYLNNFDYSEVYKLELWMLGFLSSNEEWQSLRKHTLRSHPSITFGRPYSSQFTQEYDDLVEKFKSMEASICLMSARTRREMEGVITGYFNDMYECLLQQWRLLRPGGYLAFVVANSRHQWLPIATDVILGTIAQRIGFVPLEQVILKKRNGRTRQKAYLHESITLMSKPF